MEAAFLPDILGLQSGSVQLLRAACLPLQRQNLRSYRGTCQLLLLVMLTQESQHTPLYDDLAGWVFMMTLEGLPQPLLNNFGVQLLHTGVCDHAPLSYQCCFFQYRILFPITKVQLLLSCFAWQQFRRKKNRVAS